jgi:hypothetical protein
LVKAGAPPPWLPRVCRQEGPWARGTPARPPEEERKVGAPLPKRWREWEGRGLRRYLAERERERGERAAPSEMESGAEGYSVRLGFSSRYIYLALDIRLKRLGQNFGGGPYRRLPRLID